MNDDKLLKASLQVEEMKLKAQLSAVKSALKEPDNTHKDKANKRISRSDRFVKTATNTFGLIE